MQKAVQTSFLALLLAFLLAVPAGVALWSHKNSNAYYENRALAQRPDVTLQNLWDGSFATAAESWLSDHIPGRTTLLKADTAAQMKLLHRQTVNGIVWEGGVLLPYQEYAQTDDSAQANAIGERYGKLNRHIQSLGGAFYTVGLPEQRVYFEDQFPPFLNSRAQEAATEDAAFAEALRANGVHFLDMRTVYGALGQPAAFYSAVDHHFRYPGAYAAYRATLDMLAADGWDLPVLTEEMLDFKSLPNPYLGSRNRKLYNLWPNTEQAVIGVQKEPVPFTRWDNGELSERPLFVLPESDTQPTTYNLYMGGDFGETVLKTERPELPDALIVGDSFTNALETLLYASFDETHCLDLRHYTEKSLRDYISDYKPDLVLMIQNDTFYYTTTGNGAVWEP